MKKKISIICLSLVLMLNILGFNIIADDNIHVTINGTEIEFDVPPQLIENRTMVPLRKIFEAMGATIEWNDETKTVTAIKNSDRVIATVGNKNVYVSGDTKVLDVPPLIVNDRTLVPTRFVAEAFGADVKWDELNRTVIITVKWDGQGDVPCYEHYPDIPDFGAINGLHNISGNNTSYKYDVSKITSSDFNNYLIIMDQFGFTVKTGGRIVTCQKNKMFVDIVFWGDSTMSITITE